MLFKFDYDHVEEKVENVPDDVRDDVLEAQQALAPARHRVDEGDLEMEKAGGNFTVEGMLKPDVSYFLFLPNSSQIEGGLLKTPLF